jgi:hypothetical protein
MAADSTLPPPLPRSPGGSLLDDDGNWRLKRPALIHGAEEEARTVAHLQTTVHGLAEQMQVLQQSARPDQPQPPPTGPGAEGGGQHILETHLTTACTYHLFKVSLRSRMQKALLHTFL